MMSCLCSRTSACKRVRSAASSCGDLPAGAARPVAGARIPNARIESESNLSSLMSIVMTWAPSEGEDERGGEHVVSNLRDAAVLAIVQVLGLDDDVLVGDVAQAARGAPRLRDVEALVAEPHARVAHLGAPE